jgi:uncharacterized protein YjbJ (UPF0337 family)
MYASAQNADFSGKVKEQWGTLTEYPLAVAAGTRDRLAGRIREQRGISKQEADRQLEEFVSRNRCSTGQGKPPPSVSRLQLEC